METYARINYTVYTLIESGLSLYVRFKASSRFWNIAKPKTWKYWKGPKKESYLSQPTAFTNRILIIHTRYFRELNMLKRIGAGLVQMIQVHQLPIQLTEIIESKVYKSGKTTIKRR